MSSSIPEQFLASCTSAQRDDIEKIARVCHEANRGWCAAHGDTSQRSWPQAEAWQRDSAINGVAYALCTGAGAKELHENWMDEKVKTGWRYGPVKDVAEKRHPCLVPYDLLPPEQRCKDAIFHGIVRSLAPALGFQFPEVAW